MNFPTTIQVVTEVGEEFELGLIKPLSRNSSDVHSWSAKKRSSASGAGSPCFIRIFKAEGSNASEYERLRLEYLRGVSNEIRSSSSFLSIPLFQIVGIIKRGGVYNGCIALIHDLVDNSHSLARMCMPLKVGDSAEKTSIDVIRYACGVNSGERWIQFAGGLIGVLSGFHASGIAHGSLLPDNLLVEDERVFLVGFGYSTLGRRSKTDQYIAPLDYDFLAPEVYEKRTVWMPADIFSLGAALFLAASGYPFRITTGPTGQTRYNRVYLDSDKLRDAILKQLQPALGEIAKNAANFLAKCLRYDPSDRYISIEELGEEFDFYCSQWSNDKAAKPSRKSSVSKQVKQTKGDEPLSDEFGNLAGLVHYAQTRLQRRISQLSRHMVEVYGGRDIIISSLCRVLNSIDSSSKYLTATSLHSWTRENLGADGRFMALNRLLAKRGVFLYRVFGVDRDYYDLTPDEQLILNKQTDLLGEYPDHFHLYIDKFNQSGRFNASPYVSEAFIIPPSSRIGPSHIYLPENRPTDNPFRYFYIEFQSYPTLGQGLSSSREGERKLTKIRFVDATASDAHYMDYRTRALHLFDSMRDTIKHDRYIKLSAAGSKSLSDVLREVPDSEW